MRGFVGILVFFLIMGSGIMILNHWPPDKDLGQGMFLLCGSMLISVWVALSLPEPKRFGKYLTCRYEHEESLFMWNILDKEEARWFVQDGLRFADYYYCTHRIFPSIKTVIYFGYQATEHPMYKKICNKYDINID